MTFTPCAEFGVAGFSWSMGHGCNWFEKWLLWRRWRKATIYKIAPSWIGAGCGVGVGGSRWCLCSHRNWSLENGRRVTLVQNGLVVESWRLVSFEGCCELPSGSVELCASNWGQRSWHVASGLTVAKAGIFEPRKLRTPGSLEEHSQQNEYLLWRNVLAWLMRYGTSSPTMAACRLEKLKSLELLSPWGWTPQQFHSGTGRPAGVLESCWFCTPCWKAEETGVWWLQRLAANSRVDALTSKRWKRTRTRPCSSPAPLYIWLLLESGVFLLQLIFLGDALPDQARGLS